MFNFFNKQNFCILAIILSLPSFASLNPNNESYTPSYYLGIGLGGVNGEFQTTSDTEVYPSFSFFSNQLVNPKISDTKLLGSIYIGRLFAFKHLLFGPEFYLNIGAPNSNWTQSANLLFPEESLTTNSNSQLNNIDFGIDGRVGLLTNMTSALYARVGVSFNKLINNFTIIDSRPTIPLIETANNAANHDLVGLRIGAGLEQTISSSFSIRGDYIFTYYPSSSQYFSSVGAPADVVVQLGPLSNNTTMKVNTQVALISLVYHWSNKYEK